MDLSLPTPELQNRPDVHCNLGAAELYEEIVRRGEGTLAEGEPVVTNTGQYTGRSPRDKYIVLDGTTDGLVWWDGGEANRFTREQFNQLKARHFDLNAAVSVGGVEAKLGLGRR